jgi:hypothetical protein
VRAKRDKQKKAEEQAMQHTFLLANIASTVIYYSIRYDEKETFRPAWTENLG